MPFVLHLALSSLLTRGAALYPTTLIQRQQPSQNTDFIDPVLQPYCTFSSCWHWNQPPPDICPLVERPCANDASASDNMPPNCGIMQYRRDCYCNLKTGLSCAWSCNWKTWWQTEDWFASVCPDAPAAKPIDFSELPSCARECLDDGTFHTGCLTQTSNCFCSRGDLFGCHKNCGGEEEWRRIADWLKGVCAISEATALEALKTGQFSLWAVNNATGDGERVSPPPLPPRKPLSWDEIFVLTAASLVGLVGLVCWVYNCWARRAK